MSWMGYDEWEAPSPYIDVMEIYPAWEQEDSLVVFFIGRNHTEDAPRTFRLYSQRCAVNVTNGQLTPEPEVNIISILDARSNWQIVDVQRTSEGLFGVNVHRYEVTSS